MESTGDERGLGSSQECMANPKILKEMIKMQLSEHSSPVNGLYYRTSRALTLKHLILDLKPTSCRCGRDTA